MRILVTGARGKVGRATVDALLVAGHEVTAGDLGAPVFERDEPGRAHYVQGDLTDAGHAFAIVRASSRQRRPSPCPCTSGDTAIASR